jgi:hypothetical protein
MRKFTVLTDCLLKQYEDFIIFVKQSVCSHNWKITTRKTNYGKKTYKFCGKCNAHKIIQQFDTK